MAKAPAADVNLVDPALWDQIPETTQADLLHRAEDVVRSTLALAQGADLRATAMMGIFGAVAVALLAASATLVTSPKPPWAWVAAAITASVGLFAAAALCAVSARPTNFFVAGFEPRALLEERVRNECYRTPSLIAVVQDRIDHNRRAVRRAAALVTAALIVAALGVGAGITVFLVGNHLS